MTTLPHVELLQIDEVDQLQEALAGWDLLYTQVEPGRLKALHHQVLFEDLVVMRFVESHTVVCDYEPPADTTLFFLHSPQSPTLRWCGTDLECDNLLVNPAGANYVTHHPSSLDGFCIVVANQVLDEIEALTPALDSPRETTTSWILPFTARTFAFRRWLCRTFASRRTLLNLARDPMSATWFRERVIEGLAGTLAGELGLPQRSTLSSKPTSSRITRRALDYIEENLHEPLGTGLLARELGVSARLLQYAFRDVLQSTPREFILRRKLQAVRQELLNPRAEFKTIADVAVTYGFTEFGRFSGRYRELFGELPSATARRQRLHL